MVIFRIAACLWIIVLHTNIYSRFAHDNLPELQLMQAHPNLLVRILMYGFTTVDSFFVISGFLLVFNFLNNDNLRKELEEAELIVNIRKFFRYVLNRYLRLTPSLVLLMIIIRIMGKYLDKASVFDVRTNLIDLECSR